MKVLLIYPPVGSLKAPYLSVPALSAFLKEQGVDVTSVDLNILAFDRLLTRESLEEAGRLLERRYEALDSRDRLSAFEAGEYARIAPLVLQWKFLAENIEIVKARLRGIERKGVFGKFTFLEELAKRAIELIFLPGYDTERVDPTFLEIPHYLCPDDTTLYSSEQLVAWSLSRPSRFERVYEELLAPYLGGDFDVVGFSVSFSDQLIQAMKIANLFKRFSKKAMRVMGGAYVSRVMPGLSNPRIFDILDAVILNDGERPLLELVRCLGNNKDFDAVPNMLWKDASGVVRRNRMEPAIPQSKLPPPDFSHVPFDKYLTNRDAMELPFLLSHGCYWKKCAFCNNQLSLVTDFHTQNVRTSVLPKILRLMAATGIHSFNFVDEAMPPVTLRELSRAIIEQGVGVTWHGNVRAEDFFTPSICRLMAEAGCHEVHMGVEALDDDVLRDMKKGTTVERIARVTSNLSAAGISVHAYMIHGWPTETRRQTARCLKELRKLISAKAISTLFWHPFTLSPSAPMFRNLGDYGLSARLDPCQDIFDDVTELENPRGRESERDDRSLRRVRRLTDGLLSRVKFGRPMDSEEAMKKELSCGDPLDKFFVCPRYVVEGRGQYSITEIKKARELGAGLSSGKPLYRMLNLLTGASQEVTEDVHEIVLGCREAAARGGSLGSAADHLAQEWGLERDAVAQAVITVLPSLAELGICLSEKR